MMTPAGPSMAPATKRRTIRKMKPVKIPMDTQAIMIFGPSTAGLGISSITAYVSTLQLGKKNWGGEHTVSHCIKPSESETSLEQTQKPRNSVGPSCLVDKLREDEVGTGVSRRGTRENGD